MATMVFFHAHPDDEAIATAGTMARAAAAGDRVVLVVATGGEEGEVAEGFLTEHEQLGDRRRAETHTAASLLGVARVAWLGYRDSGMMGTAANAHHGSFWQADVEAAAHELRAILDEEAADVLVVYDSNGGYGHPDHIQVHRVGHRAAELAGTPRVYETTINRDRVIELVEMARDSGMEGFEDDDGVDPETLGLPDAEITTVVDVTDQIELKRRAMRAHASQIAEDSWFLSLPEEAFRMVFGDESYVRTAPRFEGAIPEDREDWLIGS